MHSLRTPFVSFAFVAAAAAMLPTVVDAQCTSTATSFGGASGANNTVFTTATWDPDGAGPQLPRVVVGGSFTQIGTVTTRAVAAYEPVSRTWTQFGTGVSMTQGVSTVSAIAAMPNNDLIVGGFFTGAGSTQVSNIARWGGTTWSPLGAGLFSHVRSLLVLANGTLVAASGFQVWTWNGALWSPLPGTFDYFPAALAQMPNGDLIVGGGFTTVSGTQVNCVARWDGTSWSAVGGGVGAAVSSLLVLPNGDLVATGGFVTAGGNAIGGVARWNGSTWSGFGTGFVNQVNSAARLPNGDLVVGGAFATAGGVPANSVARWDGTSWSAPGGGLGAPGAVTVHTVAALPGGGILAGGFTGSWPVGRIARWDGAAWDSLGPSTNGTVHALAALRSGGAIAGGSFTSVFGVAAAHAARYDGTTWTPVGTGLDGAVRTLLELANGDVVAGGDFTTAGGVPAARIARWDGAQWHAFGNGLSGTVHALALSPSGELVAAGAFTERVARWNGSSWVAIGPTPTGAFTLANAANGDLLVGGNNVFAGFADFVWRWDGATWTPLPGLPSAAHALMGLPNGDVLASTSHAFAANGQVHQWDGTSWSLLSFFIGGATKAMTQLPDGDVVVGTSRFDGTAWTLLAPVTQSLVAPLPPFVVEAAAFTVEGDLLFGGTFTGFAGLPANALARLRSTCNALATPSGVGCSGAGGANVLAANVLPWLGGTCETTATGMPPIGFVVRALGFTTLNVPLSAVLPQGLPGCSVLVAPDVLDVHLPAAGSCVTSFSVPATPALVGAVLHQQMLPFELGAGGAITAVTSTNALQLTLGVF